jgi:hypothetical protein
MVMLILVIDAKTYHDPVQEPVFTIFLSFFIEIFAGVENKLVFTSDKQLILQQGRFATTIGIGQGTANGVGLTVAKKVDSYRGSGAAIGNIQYMCR